MLKKIALSAAAIFAAVALAQPPAAMAANWDSRNGNSRGYSNDNGRGGFHFNRDRDYYRAPVARRPLAYQQPIRRAQQVRFIGDRDHNRDWR